MRADKARELTETAISDFETQQALAEEQEEGGSALESLVWLAGESDFLLEVPEIIDEAIQIAAEMGFSGISVAFTLDDYYVWDAEPDGEKVFASENGQWILSRYNMGSCPQWMSTAMLWISLSPWVAQGMPEDEFGPAIEVVASIYEADGYAITRSDGVLNSPRDSKVTKFLHKLLFMPAAKNIEYEQDELGRNTSFYTFAIAW